jgi:hypothetical protein
MNAVSNKRLEAVHTAGKSAMENSKRMVLTFDPKERMGAALLLGFANRGLISLTEDTTIMLHGVVKNGWGTKVEEMVTSVAISLNSNFDPASFAKTIGRAVVEVEMIE